MAARSFSGSLLASHLRLGAAAHITKLKSLFWISLIFLSYRDSQIGVVLAGYYQQIRYSQ